MELYKIRDIVREQVGGADALSDGAITWCMEKALREIEKMGNWYWMEATKSWTTVINQQTYSIYTSTSSGLNIPNFKATRMLWAQDSTDSQPVWEEVFGPKQIEEVKGSFNTTDTGFPLVYSVAEGNNDATLTLWPPKPDDTYSMFMAYYQWTSLPTDPTIDLTAGSAGHEVLKRWPEALIYLATGEGTILRTKDLQAGQFWLNRFRDPNNPNADCEYNKILRYHTSRSNASRTEIYPMTGGYASRSNEIRMGRWI